MSFIDQHDYLMGIYVTHEEKETLKEALLEMLVKTDKPERKLACASLIKQWELMDD